MEAFRLHAIYTYHKTDDLLRGEDTTRRPMIGKLTCLCQLLDGRYYTNEMYS